MRDDKREYSTQHYHHQCGGHNCAQQCKDHQNYLGQFRDLQNGLGMEHISNCNCYSLLYLNTYKIQRNTQLFFSGSTYEKRYLLLLLKSFLQKMLSTLYKNFLIIKNVCLSVCLSPLITLELAHQFG